MTHLDCFATIILIVMMSHRMITLIDRDLKRLDLPLANQQIKHGCYVNTQDARIISDIASYLYLLVFSNYVKQYTFSNICGIFFASFFDYQNSHHFSDNCPRHFSPRH